MERMGWVAMVAALCACTSVKMVQRDGCWVKHTETTFGGDKEELGFCTRPETAWAEDRLARMVQECMAQSDHRWENRALSAWNHNEPIPPQADDQDLVKTCMTQASQAIGLEAENGALKARLAELSQDRDSLKNVTEKDRVFLQQSSDKMVSALGEAAKKAPPNATATVKVESDLKTPQAPPTTVVGFAAPAAPAPVVVTTPQAAPQIIRVAPVNSCPPRKTATKKLASEKSEKDPACEKGAPAEKTAAAAPTPAAG